MTTPRLSLALPMAILPLLLASRRDDEPAQKPVPEPPKPPARGLAGAVAGLVQLPPAPRPGSGRERQIRRDLAKRIAKDIGLDVEQVYQALGRGESEENIRSSQESTRLGGA